MNRKYKRALIKYDKELSKAAVKLTKKRLKEENIDYVIASDQTILSTRDKDVQRIYDDSMLTIITLFYRFEGDIHKTLKFINYY